MDSPINSYKYYLAKYGQIGARKKVFDFFRTKYFINVPNDKETFNVARKLPFFIPGRIYTYIYDPKYKDKLDWFDTRPLMLSIRHFKAETTGNLIETGINLNFLPPNIRILILQSLYKVYAPIMESNQKLDNNKRVGRQRPLFTESYDYMAVLDWIFDTVNNTAYRFAIRNYIKPRMYQPKSISYSDFGKCAFLETKDVVGESLDEIYRIYWDYKVKKERRQTILTEKTKKYIKKRVNKDISKTRKINLNKRKRK